METYRIVESDEPQPQATPVEPTKTEPMSDRLDEMNTKLDEILKAITGGDAS